MIIFDHVSKVYPNGTVGLDDVNLTIQDGEFVAIIGRSGAGKSTLLRSVNRMHQITAGTLTVNGTDVSTLSGKSLRRFRRGIGMVFQSFNLVTRTTVIKNVLSACVPDMPFWRVLLGTFRKEDKIKALESLDKVGILDKAYMRADQLSGGQQQRVALARALVAQPGLLLLDEPLSNLDAKLRESMRFEILSIQKALGITVVYVTHDQGEAMAMSDRVVVMSKGVVQQIGAPHEIYTNPANKMVADFIGLVNFMQGEVSDDRVYLQGTTASFPNTSGVSGSATIAVRPENITMSRGGGMLEGTLTHRFYLGDAVDYRVTVGDHDVRVIVKGADLKEFADGEKVYLDFEKVMIFDRE